jgi:acyl dehydratase
MTADEQRHWEDVHEGDELAPVAFPLSVYRLVVAAGSTRDFNSIHHNAEVARATGAPDIYANTLFLLGMWERAVREFIGLRGVIRRFAGFHMSTFNAAGDTVTVRGRVQRTWREGGRGLAELEVWSENRHGVSVGPGTVTVELPTRD